jgi:hypothetical protein
MKNKLTQDLRGESKKNVSVVNEGGLSYNEISEIMTRQGDKMNHSNVRAIILKSFMKIADNISKEYGLKHDYNKLLEIAIRPDFQESVVEILDEELNKKRKKK